MFKVLVMVFFAVILYSLASALYYLVHHKTNDSTKVVKALSWRIGLSLLLFLLLLLSYTLGFITPHGL